MQWHICRRLNRDLKIGAGLENEEVFVTSVVMASDIHRSRRGDQWIAKTVEPSAKLGQIALALYRDQFTIFGRKNC